MKKRKLVVLLAGAIFISQLGCLKAVNITGTEVIAQAEEVSQENEFSEGNFTYVLKEDGTAKITKYVGDSKELTIPDKVEKDNKMYDVTVLGRGSFSENIELESVKIPEGITNIDNSAFYECKNLKNVIFPDSLRSIGHNVFSDCSIEDLKLPKNLKEINNYSFSGNPLKNVLIQSDIEELGEAFGDVSKNANLKISGNIKIINFTNIAQFKSISIDENNDYYTKVNGIIYNKDLTEAEYLDKDIKEIDKLPDSLKKINNSCFIETEISKIDLPESLTSIGDKAFKDCKNLTDVSIPEGVDYIGKFAFAGCSKLESIEIPEGIESIEDYTFCNCEALKTITLPSSLTSIKMYAFCVCKSLNSIDVPENVSEIGMFAFCQCDSLKTVDFKDNAKLNVIGDYSFNTCSSLTEIKIPESVQYIGSFAFYGCDSVKNLELGNNSSEFKFACFYCNNLNNITYHNCTDADIEPKFFPYNVDFAKVILESIESSDVQYVRKGCKVLYDSDKYVLYENGQIVTDSVVNEDRTFDLQEK